MRVSSHMPRVLDPVWPKQVRPFRENDIARIWISGNAADLLAYHQAALQHDWKNMSLWGDIYAWPGDPSADMGAVFFDLISRKNEHKGKHPTEVLNYIVLKTLHTREMSKRYPPTFPVSHYLTVLSSVFLHFERNPSLFLAEEWRDLHHVMQQFFDFPDQSDLEDSSLYAHYYAFQRAIMPFAQATDAFKMYLRTPSPFLHVIAFFVRAYNQSAFQVLLDRVSALQYDAFARSMTSPHLAREYAPMIELLFRSSAHQRLEFFDRLDDCALQRLSPKNFFQAAFSNSPDF